MAFHMSFIGNLGRDPEMRYTATGTPVANFSVAVNRRWNNSAGELQEETVWIRVTTWGQLAENCNRYLTQGRQVYCEGRLNPDPETGGPRVWVGNDGQARASYEVTANQVQFLGARPEGSDEPSIIPAPEEPSADEIPF